MIGDDIEVTVLSVHGEKVRLGIAAPSEVPVYRTEVYRVIQQEHREGVRRGEVSAEADDPLRDLGRSPD